MLLLMADSRLWKMCTSQYRGWETAESTIIKLTRKFVTRQEACQQAGGALAEYVRTRQINLTPAVCSHNRSFVSQKHCFLCNQVGNFAKDCPVSK